MRTERPMGDHSIGRDPLATSNGSDSMSAQIAELRLRRTLLLERLASVKGLAAEREERIADLRLALLVIPKVGSGSPARVDRTEADFSVEASAQRSALTVRTGQGGVPSGSDHPVAENPRLWTRELGRRTGTDGNGHMWETFEDTPRPKWWQSTLTWPGRRPPRD